VQLLFWWKSNNYYMFWVCICSLRYPARNKHVPHCHLWSLWLNNIFPRYLTCGTIFERKKIIEHKLCVLIFSTTSEGKTFHSNKKIGEIWSKMASGLHVKYPLFLSDFKETWIFLTGFQKILKIQKSMKICPMGAELFLVDGQICWS
jgi:hypothetical protein